MLLVLPGRAIRFDSLFSLNRHPIVLYCLCKLNYCDFISHSLGLPQESWRDIKRLVLQYMLNDPGTKVEADNFILANDFTEEEGLDNLTKLLDTLWDECLNLG